MLLVESAQSVANRLETVCWDEAVGDSISEPKRITLRQDQRCGTRDPTRIQEFHRLNSPYIWMGEKTIGVEGLVKIHRADRHRTTPGKMRKG